MKATYPLSLLFTFGCCLHLIEPPLFDALLVSVAGTTIPPPPAPIWYVALVPILESIGGTLPAFLVGYLAGRSGFILGASVAGLGGLSAVVVNEFWLRDFQVSWEAIAGALPIAIAGAILGACAGAAGQLLRALPSNYAFNRTAGTNRGDTHRFRPAAG